MKVASSVLELIGETPLVRINRLTEEKDAQIWAKLESFNPGGSVKDRIALHMIRDAEERGLLEPGGTIVEPTSGNTGVGLAMVAAALGYKLIICMPETMSAERRRILQLYGAEIILTPGELGMVGSIRKAEEILEKNPTYFMPQQFTNLANPEIHRRTTAQEILAQCEGHLDALVAGIGTGGTITGVGEILKKHLPNVKIVAVEPDRSAVLSGEESGPHSIQGIGAGFVPTVLNQSVYDQIIRVTDEEALCMVGRLARKEGIFCGISAGAAMTAAVKTARELGAGTKVVVILPDTGERYLSVASLFMSEG